MKRGKPKKQSAKNRLSGLLVACRNGDETTVRQCLANGDDSNALGPHKVTPLMEAASRGFASIVRSLLYSGADVNLQTTARETALAYAAANGHVKVVELLLNADANPNCHVSIGAGKLSALSVAAGRGDLKCVKVLITGGAHPEGWNEPEKPAVVAAGNGHVEVVHYLLKHGMNPNAKGHQNKTALLRFSAVGSVEGVKLLLLHKAQLNLADSYGITAFSWACRNGHLEVARLLLQNGADPLAKGAIDLYRDLPGESALYWALQQKQRRIVRWLLSLKKTKFTQFERDQAKDLLGT